MRIPRLKLRAALVAALVVLQVGSAHGAILNSLRGWSEDEPGWSGGLTGSFGASGGNSPQTIFEGSGRLQFRSEPNVFRLIITGRKTSAQGVETANATLGHLRHNYLLSERWATLTFLQYMRNPFQRLDSRTLLGLGARWMAVENKETRLYLGAAQMFEQERIQDVEGYTKAQRLSSFVSVEKKISEDVELDFLVFYQPRWSDFQDWRLFGEVSLDIELTGSLSLFTGYVLQYNSTPPEGVKDTDWNTKTGFAITF